MLGSHVGAGTDGFIEPRRPLIEQIPEGVRVVGVECERVMPAGVRAIHHSSEATLERVSLGHRFADEHRVSEDLGLPRIRFEWFALLYAERLEHRVEETVALVDRFALDDLVEALPIFHSARRHTAPTLAVRRDNPG